MSAAPPTPTQLTSLHLHALHKELTSAQTKKVFVKDPGSQVFFRADYDYVLKDVEDQMHKLDEQRMHAAIVVLGDIGRSPRMRFHAMSLARHGVRVDVLGFVDSGLPKWMRSEPLIRVVPLASPPGALDGLPRPVAMLLKVLFTSVLLFASLLFRISFPRILIMQNPPGVPTLPVCWLACLLKRCKLIIDWHNYTYSILEWEQGSRAKSVKLAKCIEARFGPRAHASLCVTRAMRADLKSKWGVKAITLYDRPPGDFALSFGAEERHSFYQRMAKDCLYEVFMSKVAAEPPHLADYAEVTALSYRKKEGGEAKLRSDRAAILVSGTSWTADEDFGILLSALEKYDAMAAVHESEAGQRLPRILAVITGKGPLKAHYMALMKEKRLEQVEFLTPWLEAEDYPRMLAAADLGVSLHASTSGLDLPMKVVDMFGVGLPVLAKKFACIDELVKPGDNGLLFNTAQDLANSLSCTLRGFPESSGCRLWGLQASLAETPLVSWEENWDAVLWPLVRPLL